MARASKFLVPVRQSISFITSSSCSLVRRSRHSCGSLKEWVRSFEHVMYSRASTLDCRFNIQRKFGQDFCLSGSRASGTIFGASVLFGSIYFWPYVVYAMDGHDVLMDEPDVEFLSALDGEEDLNILSRLMRKFWLPLFLIFCVFVNRSNPITLVSEIILFLLGTKPSPFSIYLFVERLCRQLMRQEPHLYRLKSLCASKIEVQDYYLFCLARVEVRGQKLNLVGILGGWWPLPSSIYFPSSLVCQNIQIPSKFRVDDFGLFYLAGVEVGGKKLNSPWTFGGLWFLRSLLDTFSLFSADFLQTRSFSRDYKEPLTNINL